MAAQLDKSHIAVIGAAAFIRCCKEAKQDPLVLMPRSASEVTGKSSSLSSNVPPELADFADVFDEGLSDQLAPHRPYDLKIELEEGKSPLIGHVYPASDSELGALQKFIEEHLRIGFIQPSSSSHTV